MKKRRAKTGDVFQIATAGGFAYAQLTHRHRLFGCLLRILPGVHSSPLMEFAAKASEKELYHVFVFEDDLYEEPVITFVANEAVPEQSSSFPIFRDGVRDPKSGRVATWWLWDGTNSWRIGDLNEEQKNLPIREILNYKILSERIGSGWMPASDS